MNDRYADFALSGRNCDGMIRARNPDFLAFARLGFHCNPLLLVKASSRHSPLLPLSYRINERGLRVKEAGLPGMSWISTSLHRGILLSGSCKTVVNRLVLYDDEGAARMQQYELLRCSHRPYILNLTVLYRHPTL